MLPPWMRDDLNLKTGECYDNIKYYVRFFPALKTGLLRASNAKMQIYTKAHHDNSFYTSFYTT